MTSIIRTIRDLMRGVNATMAAFENGEKVMVFCESGRHRRVAMACCILVTKGYKAGEAMQLAKEKREKADPYAGYIRKQIEIFETDWNEHHSPTKE